MEHKTDILIVGGGSAGFGAAWRAIRSGLGSVTLLERNPGLGGTSTFGGVNCWEPGVGGNGAHHLLARRLQNEGAAFVGKTVEFVTLDTPWGVSQKCEDPYSETLERSFRDGHEQRRFHFEPQAMEKAMLDLLREADTQGRASLFFEAELTGVERAGRQIIAVTAQTQNGSLRIVPKMVLDCTGDIIVARMAGCETQAGEDSAAAYQEPCAPDHPQRIVNGITQVFRVTPCEADYTDSVPEEYGDVDLTEWLQHLDKYTSPVSCFNFYPNGDININMLPTLPGEMWLDLPGEQVQHMARARAYAYWHWVQTRKHFRGYRIREMFPMMGIRESYRLVGRYVLKEQDLRNGYPAELGEGHTVARGDHPADIHGKSNTAGVMNQFAPYGIPYECMLPKEIDNMLVACRGASFSHIAASSARLSRTMIALGEAAGEAAAQCVERGCLPPQADVAALRKKLQI